MPRLGYQDTGAQEMIDGSSRDRTPCQYSSTDRASAVTVYQGVLDKRLSIYFQIIQSTQVKLNRQKKQKKKPARTSSHYWDRWTLQVVHIACQTVKHQISMADVVLAINNLQCTLNTTFMRFSAYWEALRHTPKYTNSLPKFNAVNQVLPCTNVAKERAEGLSSLQANFGCWV